jgi:hypothetical protein
MLYTMAQHSNQKNWIRLYFSYDAARSVCTSGRPVRKVAVHFDALLRRLLPLRPLPEGIDACWSTPAEYDGDLAITVQGLIPEPLYCE